MEYYRIPGTILRDNSLLPLTRLIYGVVYKYARYGRADGFCWASNKYLAQMFAVSERTIDRAIQSLEDKHYLYTDQLFDKYGRKATRKIYPTYDLDAT